MTLPPAFSYDDTCRHEKTQEYSAGDVASGNGMGFPTVIVIGGGPAGLFCALRISGEGRKVVVLEKMPSCGRKLLLTGLGQCNLTHDGDIRSFFEKYGDNGPFLRPALMNFTNQDLRAFCEEKGVPLGTMESGKIFPLSKKASDVLSLLLRECRIRGVEICCNEAVLGVGIEEHTFFVQSQNSIRHASFLVIATGGASYPGTGSSGDGYKMARSLGHAIAPPAPALTPVYVKEYPFAHLAGISFPHVTFYLFRRGKKIRESTGDLLFTHSGLSGPGILHLSRYIEAGDELKVSFLPGLSAAHLSRRIQEAASAHGNRQVKAILTGYGLPLRFVKGILTRAGLSETLTGAHLSKKDRDRLAAMVCAFPFPVSLLGGFDEAMVTRGGVSLCEIDSKTMESRVVRGLYCIGEVLDIDGDTGGYNLQAAFSTAASASRDIVSKTRILPAGR
ncbi:MAG: NAD(P)/FAD-dependent oxidoreductase [Methanomicrobiales archaeon]|nr:NAD(P)/FAD-dependent oxidoreductase [Methanomicrobiales archaeon]